MILFLKNKLHLIMKIFKSIVNNILEAMHAFKKYIIVLNNLEYALFLNLIYI